MYWICQKVKRFHKIGCHASASIMTSSLSFYWSCDFYSMVWQCYKTDSHPNEVLLELFNSLKDLLSWNGWNVINDSVFAFSPHISTLTILRSNMIHRSHFQVVNLFIILIFKCFGKSNDIKLHVVFKIIL